MDETTFYLKHMKKIYKKDQEYTISRTKYIQN